MIIIERNIDQIKHLCGKYNVAKLFVFGSALTKKYNVSSDIDFVVDFAEVDLYEYADNYFMLK